MSINYLRYKIFKPLKSWKSKYLKYLATAISKETGLLEEAVKEISEYTGESSEIIRQKHKSCGPEPEKNYAIFKDQSGLTASGVESFYKECGYYLYELPLWNAEGNRPFNIYLIISGYLKSHKYNKVLDFGGGAGDLCLELSRHSLDVSYCDIGETLYNFARWRFTRRNVPVRMFKGIGTIVGNDYDCILSFDAFEHVKDLPQVIKKLFSYLKPGGSLIFSGAFSGGTLHLEENESYNKFNNLDKLMREIGFTFQDRFAQYYFYSK